MTNKEKLQDALEQVLWEMSQDARVQKRIHLENGIDRLTLAEHIAEKLVEEPRFRSGRRISDALKDKLLDLQRWVMKR